MQLLLKLVLCLLVVVLFFVGGVGMSVVIVGVCVGVVVITVVAGVVIIVVVG